MRRYSLDVLEDGVADETEEPAADGETRHDDEELLRRVQVV